MSSHQMSAKPRSSKCRHFCLLLDPHNYCPTCRESGKGDDPCVTNQSPCNICANFSEEQQIKIKHRRQYGNKRYRILIILVRMMIWTYWGTMWRHFLALKQTLRVLLIIKRPVRDADLFSQLWIVVSLE